MRFLAIATFSALLLSASAEARIFQGKARVLRPKEAVEADGILGKRKSAEVHTSVDRESLLGRKSTVETITNYRRLKSGKVIKQETVVHDAEPIKDLINRKRDSALAKFDQVTDRVEGKLNAAVNRPIDWAKGKAVSTGERIAKVSDKVTTAADGVGNRTIVGAQKLKARILGSFHRVVAKATSLPARLHESAKAGAEKHGSRLADLKAGGKAQGELDL